FREIYLLVNEKSREKDKETVITVVQHELSHQWFGNLVTCSWWSYLWLNEAFATLFEYFAVQAAEPNWRIGDMFVIEQHQTALAYDHRPKHPLTASVNTPKEIIEIFDTITYSKGASILRMLKHSLDDDIFRSSLSLYLNNNKFTSVEPKHLWNSFDNVIFEASYKSGLLGDKVTIEDYMNSWTNQAGYPVIYVETINDNLVITQKRFQVDFPRVDDNTLWYIGLSYTTEKNKQFHFLQPTVWMKNTENKITIPRSENSGWVIFNLQSSGFYRVNYDTKNWDLIIAQMKNDPKEIHVLNRAQLVDDAFNLARAGELSYSVPLTLVSYLVKEDDFIPMYSVMNSMSYLVKRFRRCPTTGRQIKELVKKYAEIAYEKVKYLYEINDGKHLTKTSMNAISNWACKLEVESCVKSASNYFNAWQENSTKIPSDVKDAAFCIGVKNGTQDTWNTVFQLYLKTSSTSEKRSALLALACSTDSKILSNYLSLLLNDDCPIRTQDFLTVFATLVSTPTGINVTTEFLQNNINKSIVKMWKGEEMIADMFDMLASAVATNVEIDELKAIKNLDYLSPALKTAFNESYKEVELNSNYFERSHPLLHKWFNPNEDRSAQSSAISNLYLPFNFIILSLFSIVILLKNNIHYTVYL
ncbi:aminopeptidase N-like, partial [Sipha flava]|uniref:Aminopeptidase N n=1 Tax=Sipha flava TaxID=143950 RepID=A0A8B8GAE7_9HEMI